MRRIQTLTTAVIFLHIMATATHAHASPKHDAVPHTTAHTTLTPGELAHHTPNVVGVKIFGLSAFEQLDVPHVTESMAYGGGLFYERSFVHGMLDVEFAALLCRNSETTVAPIEALLKKPFHPTEHLTLYMGVGPALDIVLHDGETKLVPAVNAVVGGYGWFSHRVGMDVEITLGHLFEHHGKGLQELMFATGPAFRF